MLLQMVESAIDTILRSQGITPNASTRNALYSQKNFVQAGSGCLVGGADAAQQIADTASSLNVSGFTASELMLLMHENEKKNNALLSHHENKVTTPLSCKDLMKQYKDSPFLTACQVFRNENGHLGAEVRDEVIHRNEARKEKEFAVVSRKKMKLWEFISRVKVIKDKMKGKIFKLTVNKLCLLVTYKKTKEDAAIPSGKAALLT